MRKKKRKRKSESDFGVEMICLLLNRFCFLFLLFWCDFLYGMWF